MTLVHNKLAGKKRKKEGRKETKKGEREGGKKERRKRGRKERKVTSTTPQIALGQCFMTETESKLVETAF